MSILSVAYSGLNAFQYALDVTANNIANSITPGYSRQSILLTPSLGERYAGTYVGTGVMIDSIYRNVDQFAVSQARNMYSSKNQFDTFYQQANQIDQMLSQDGSSISTAMQGFFDSFNQLNSSPDSAPSRGVALSQSQLMVRQFNFIQKNLDDLQQNSKNKIDAAAKEINAIGSSLVSLNAQLMGAPNSPELLDQRDQLLSQLSAYSELSVSFGENGIVNVGIATGEMLVVGPNQRIMSVKFDPLNASGSRVLLSGGTGTLDITAQLTTGMLGGFLDYEKNIITPASQTIGLMAMGLAQSFNTQNKLGMDLNNQIGQNIFTDYSTMAHQLQRSVPSGNNTGSGVLSVDLTDLSQVQISDYQLIIDDIGSNKLHVVRQSDGAVTNLVWSTNPPAPPAGQINIDGMAITIDDIANLANNDTYTINPTRGAARELNLQINDANLFALAAPVRTTAALANTGSGNCALGTVFNTSAVNNQYSIEFTSPTEFNVYDVTSGTQIAGPVSFIPNTDNVVQIPDSMNPSYSIILSGVPNAGDQFTAEYNQGGYGDNRNGLLLSGIQQKQIFNNESSSLFTTYSDLLSNIGAQTKQSLNRAQAFDVLYRQAVDYAESKSGVNLDEEAQNLLRFEQAYAAAGKVVEVANEMMHVLFEMMR